MNRLLALLIFSAAFQLQASDWMQFRGPNSGVSEETDLPTVLDAQNSIAWKSTLPGRGISSPIIVGNRVFVTCASGAQQDRLHVICFNAGDGSKRWEREFWATGRTTCHEKISVAAPSPASDGEHIFALFSSNDLFCLDLDGNLLWLRGLMRDYPNASNGLGLAASPVVSVGVFVAQIETDGEAFVAGIDVATGRNLWKIERPKKANWTSPQVMKAPSGKSFIILQGSSGVTAIDPTNGTIVWNYTEGAATLPTSAIHGDVIFVPSSGVTAIQVNADGGSFKQLWRATQLRTSTPSPLVTRERIFTLNDAGVLTCADTVEGKRLWQSRLTAPFSATPVAAGKHLYLVNEKGLLQIVDASSEDGVITSQLDLGETIIGTPSISHGGLYLRSDAHLWKIAKVPTL
ncbi:MAG: outer rane biosis protein [Verrucomicrobiales bacterium]|nr:outer rane biosis protein [Verrucomicrobiales bacterium]